MLQSLTLQKKTPVQRTDITAVEAVRSVQAGILCQGIFLPEEVNEMVKECEMVKDESESLEFKKTRPVHEIFHNEFTCKETMS